MPHTFESALNNSLIHVVSRNDSSGVYEIRVGELETIVTIELGRLMDSDRTRFSLSHTIKTPTQAGPYRTSVPIADYPAYALLMAITGLTQYYRDAVKEGHKPNENWLVKI